LPIVYWDERFSTAAVTRALIAMTFRAPGGLKSSTKWRPPISCRAPLTALGAWGEHRLITLAYHHITHRVCLRSLWMPVPISTLLWMPVPIPTLLWMPVPDIIVEHRLFLDSK